MRLWLLIGKPVWKFQTGGAIVAAPVTHTFRGKQYLTVAAGRVR